MLCIITFYLNNYSSCESINQSVNVDIQEYIKVLQKSYQNYNFCYFMTFFSFVAHVTSVPALSKDFKATLQLVEDLTVIYYVFSHLLMPLAMQSGHRVTNECGQLQPQQQLILRLCYTQSRLRVDTGDGITIYGIRTDCCSVKRAV